MRRPIDCAPHCDEPQRKKRRLPSKHVTFADDLTTVKYRQINSDDLQHAWLQAADYKTIKKDAFEVVLIARKMFGELDRLDEEKFCIRGLEGAILKMMKKRINARTQLFHFVLEEQRVQRILGVSNTESLRSISSILSNDDCTLARNLATTHQC
jgi:hypothetical protein